jgi:hypothetical protein
VREPRRSARKGGGEAELACSARLFMALRCSRFEATQAGRFKDYFWLHALFRAIRVGQLAVLPQAIGLYLAVGAGRPAVHPCHQIYFLLSGLAV